MLSLQQLNTFIHCAQAGSFSAAARRLGKAQSVVSQAIANLEIDLGQTLFDRSSRKPTLTPHGQILLQQAQAVMQQAQDLQATAAALTPETEPSLTIALDQALTLPSLYQLIQRFSQRFHATELVLEICQSNQIPPLVRQGRAHIGLMLTGQDMPAGVNLGLLGQLPFYAVASPLHPLAQLQSVSRSEITLHRQLITKNSNNKAVEQLQPISPKVYWSNDFEALKQLAIANLGWGYLPAHLAQSEVDNQRLVKLPVSFDIETWSVPVDRVTPLNSAKGLGQRWLEEQCEQLLQ
ncbi:LysR family transcriptional regulator [Ferrimonas lipolytica]|uniref:LysR family transcriptional regulator n=1 Tax=Ferrimonas lipolytica TaxID=2724191 RepID=A0A6H1U9V8_9GAMM|nr:LysR family transcriptional regulator [Ferrimonas lipolytica]QIZ75814.1 LysR family transcriptional regulator [Ferrimonas lipolytica]